MNKTETVLSVLKSLDIDSVIEDGRNIVWFDTRKGKYRINTDNIDIKNRKVAWFQAASDDSDERFVIYENDKLFSFLPETLHPGYGCDIYLLEWHDENLIVIYHEKHNVVISSVKDQSVKTFQFHGDQMVRRGNHLYFREYGNIEFVRILKIPELAELPAITKDEAINGNLNPETLGYLNNLRNVEHQ